MTTKLIKLDRGVLIDGVHRDRKEPPFLVDARLARSLIQCGAAHEPHPWEMPEDPSPHAPAQDADLGVSDAEAPLNASEPGEDDDDPVSEPRRPRGRPRKNV